MSIETLYLYRPFLFKKCYNYNIMKTKHLLIIIFVISLIIRIYLGITTLGEPHDINTYLKWIKQIEEFGILNTYNHTTGLGQNSFIYPPLMAYLFALLAKIISFIPNNLEVLFLKIPAIIADLVTGFLIYLFTKRHINTALILTTLYLLHPIVIYTSSVWGQLDSLIVPFIISTFYIVNKRPFLATFLLTLAVLIKLQSLFFFPLLFFIIFKKYHLKKTIISLFACFTTIVISILPFLLTSQLIILYNNIVKRSLEVYSALSANAFNIWWGLFGQKANLINDTFSVFSIINLRYLSLTIVTIIYIITFYKLLGLKKETNETYFLYAGFISFLCFMVLTQMHERYFFPLIALLTLSLTKFIWLKKIYLILSITLFLNLLYYFPISNIDFTLIHQPIINTILSLINLIILLYFIKKLFIYENRNNSPLL